MTAIAHIGFEQALAVIPSITLDQMDSIKLMNRIDSKYLTSEDVLLRILSDAAAAGYRALDIGGLKISRYNSVYFDTAALRMFYDHRNKHLVRQKVRTRSYLESGQTFLEIKRKNNHGRTKKSRMPIPGDELMGFESDASACDFLANHSWFAAGDLLPVLSTAFRRITLVNPAMTERLTIDTALEFENFRTGRGASLGNAVIIELKQDGRIASQMRDILLDHRVKPIHVSKYCVAVTLTDPSVKAGRFKEKIRKIEKTTGNKLYDL